MFGFNNVHRDTTLKKNFLKTVVFQLDFNEIFEFSKFKDKIVPFFEEEFIRISDNFKSEIKIEFKPNQTPILNQSNDSDSGFEMKTSSGQEVIKFNKTSISYVITGQEYKGFYKITDKINSFIEILKLLNIEKVQRIAIRKLNIIEFKDVENPSEILHYLINPELLSNLDYFPNQKLIRQNIHSINYVDNSYYLNIRYGLNLIPPNFEVGQTIIDIDLFNISDILIGSIEKECSKINQEIYNVFSWTISEGTMQLLKN